MFVLKRILKITQKNLDVLHWAYSHTHLGRIQKNRTTSDWIVKNQHDCETILRLILPYSIGKRKQVDLALDILRYTITSKDDLLMVARLADSLSSFNVRSLGRRKNYASKILEHSSSND